MKPETIEIARELRKILDKYDEPVDKILRELRKDMKLDSLDTMEDLSDRVSDQVDIECGVDGRGSDHFFREVRAFGAAGYAFMRLREFVNNCDELRKWQNEHDREWAKKYESEQRQ